MGCHALLQGIFLTQGLNPHLLHWQADFYFIFFTTEPPSRARLPGPSGGELRPLEGAKALQEADSTGARARVGGTPRLLPLWASRSASTLSSGTGPPLPFCPAPGLEEDSSSVWARPVSLFSFPYR